MRMLLIHLAAVALLCTGHMAQADRVASAQPAYARISYVDSQLNSAGSRGYRFRLTNVSGKPLYFDGYSDSSPLYSVRAHRLGLWWYTAYTIIGWCGTGLEPREIAPGASFSFWVDDPGTNWSWKTGVPIRLVRARDGSDFTVWSEASRRK